MTELAQYEAKYSCARLSRENGVLEVHLHTDGGPLQWGPVASSELPELFHDIAQDLENRVVILTGTGDTFCGPKANPKSWPRKSAAEWDQTIRQEMRMGLGMLEIGVPMIAAVNGPALRHSELPLLCDIVLASESATFMDSGHFPIGAVPGDAVHIVYPLLMGINRGRYFLLTGQTLDAPMAREAGLVNEVMSAEALLPRARELAADIAAKPALAIRYSRMILTHRLKQEIHATLGFGMALAGICQSLKD